MPERHIPAFAARVVAGAGKRRLRRGLAGLSPIMRSRGVDPAPPKRPLPSGLARQKARLARALAVQLGLPAGALARGRSPASSVARALLCEILSRRLGVRMAARALGIDRTTRARRRAGAASLLAASATARVALARAELGEMR